MSSSSSRAIPTDRWQIWGTITDLSAGRIGIAGISAHAGAGQEVRVETPGGPLLGEILSVEPGRASAALNADSHALRIGQKVHVLPNATVCVGDHWLGQIVDSQGDVLTSASCADGGAATIRMLKASAPPTHLRRSLGQRLKTGLMVTDTLLPICRGQRIGLFAGSGVGKSRLVGALANGIDASRIVIALVGERSREVNDFLYNTLDAATRERTVVVAATAGEPPGAKKRAAYCAMAAAEHFRDQGHHVLLIFDSLTRFAEAHREIALLSGETPALNAFPPSTVRVISELVERAGPGTQSCGDITGVFSVLVAGSDFEEPVADMIRGILDGHILLSREIAERGRYPAIDVVRSVSRALPGAATDEENALLRDYRKLVALYGELAPMIRASLYVPGQDAEADRAIALYPALDAFAAEKNNADLASAFAILRERLNR